jgi:hypothetical protein
MPTFRIHIANKDFTASKELPSLEAVKSEAMPDALAIGADEVCGGSAFFGAEVLIEQDGETIERLVVALGASTLR